MNMFLKLSIKYLYFFHRMREYIHDEIDLPKSVWGYHILMDNIYTRTGMTLRQLEDVCRQINGDESSPPYCDEILTFDKSILKSQ